MFKELDKLLDLNELLSNFYGYSIFCSLFVVAIIETINIWILRLPTGLSIDQCIRIVCWFMLFYIVFCTGIFLAKKHIKKKIDILKVANEL